MKNENIIVVVAALLLVLVLAILVTLGAVGDSRRAELEALEAQQKLEDEKNANPLTWKRSEKFEELLRRQKETLKKHERN